ncbi:hypothetical protein Taro_032338 [Colocasia esculenta]|uniref:Uncharacterized protein n=1 Tax=Colocasia esculenta TaxID=4460 RepID=A0A843W3M2_COLES|nr:hypothetical protein [Colocasia esculenta]
MWTSVWVSVKGACRQPVVGGHRCCRLHGIRGYERARVDSLVWRTSELRGKQRWVVALITCGAPLAGLCLRGVRCRMVVVAACSPCIPSRVSCERGCSCIRIELRVAFLQVLGLFEFITYLTGLNSNPSKSSDLWVAAPSSRSLVGV